MRVRRALITGITGQDGSYLAEFLLSKGYEVFGLVRKTTQPNYPNIKHIFSDITLVYGDMTDGESLEKAIRVSAPDEIYNLAAQSHVQQSFERPIYTSEVTGLGAFKLLESVRLANPKIRFYQASSSEMFGNSQAPQNEQTGFNPRSPYAAAKAVAHYAVKNYREAYGMFCVSGICFNHESPRRGEEFVTRKITKAAARIKHGLQSELRLGNLLARRDWGFAGDYVEAMWLMLQNDKPEDFVIGTGNAYSVLELLGAAFGLLNLDLHKYVMVDKAFERPAEVSWLQADISLIKSRLGWQPKTDFQTLVKMMVESDLEEANRESSNRLPAF